MCRSYGKEICSNNLFSSSSLAERLIVTAVVCEECDAYRQCLKLLHSRLYFFTIDNFCSRLTASRFQ